MAGGGPYAYGSYPDIDGLFREQAVEVDRKRAIARAAAQLVGEGEAVALDASTTAYYLALELRAMRELVVVTDKGAQSLHTAPRGPRDQTLRGGELVREAVVASLEGATHAFRDYDVARKRGEHGPGDTRGERRPQVVAVPALPSSEHRISVQFDDFVPRLP